MRSPTDKERKEDIIERMIILKRETELILDQPDLRAKINRINKGIRAFTHLCSICRHDRVHGCPPDCIFGIDKSCRDYFWHPDPKSTEKKDYQQALDFLEFAIPELRSLPDFCFSFSYSKTLREYFRELDDVFRSEQEKPPKERKPRQKQSFHNDKFELL